MLAAALLLLAAAPAGAGPPARVEPVEPASLLLVTLDTTRADHLGCYGATFAATPRLDALAAGGVRFERALAPAPITLPSHATMLTGLVPRRHGVRANSRFPLGPEPPVLAEALAAAGYRTAAFVSSAVLDRRAGLERGFAHYDDTVRVGDRRAFNYEERAASQTVDAVLARLPELEPPFLLWVHLFDPHLPYVPPEPFRSRFADRPYDGEIAFADAQFGRLLDAVRRRAGPLLVAVAGDHGESLGEHDEDGHGVFLYQSTQRVPLILAGPGVPAGRVVERNVGLVDLAPTLLELLGLVALEGIDGVSLRPLLEADAADGTGPPYELESFFPRLSYGWSPLRALVHGRWKYVEAPEPELYDLGADPGERRNLVAERGRIARRLARMLAGRIGDDDPGFAAAPDDPELAERRRRLESLGYVGGATAPPGAGDVEPDPKRMIGLVRELDRARRELAGGEREAATARLERLLERSPRTLPAWLVLAQCRLAAGNAAQAEADARRALELAPDDALAWFHLANALAAGAGESDQALERARAAYGRTLELDPRHADAHLNYASLLVRHRRLDAARDLLAGAVDRGLRDPDVEVELGLLELAQGRPAAATAALERALTLHRCARDANETLGRIAYGRGRAAVAASHYERALECAPSADTAKTLGSIYRYDLEDPRRARRAWTRALELLDPADPDVPVLRALIAQLDAAG